jgi:hypothetical protein
MYCAVPLRGFEDADGFGGGVGRRALRLIACPDQPRNHSGSRAFPPPPLGKVASCNNFACSLVFFLYPQEGP